MYFLYLSYVVSQNGGKKKSVYPIFVTDRWYENELESEWYKHAQTISKRLVYYWIRHIACLKTRDLPLPGR